MRKKINLGDAKNCLLEALKPGKCLIIMFFVAICNTAQKQSVPFQREPFMKMLLI